MNNKLDQSSEFENFGASDPETTRKIKQYDRMISDNLRLVRELNQVTRNELAGQVNISEEEIKDYEEGASIPASLLSHFAAALGVSIEVFYAGL